jgi:hypothetical protein
MTTGVTEQARRQERQRMSREYTYSKEVEDTSNASLMEYWWG